MKRSCFCLLLAVMTISFAAHAQDQPPNPAVVHLMEAYSVDQAEAQKRLDLQFKVAELSDRLNKENDPAYADMYITHKPRYRVIVRFAGNSNKSRKALVDSLDPQLRPHVKLRGAKRSRGATARSLDQLNAALRQLSIPFTSEYNLETQRFSVIVEDPSDVERVESVLPRARRRDTTVEVGLIPKIEALPTGVQPGDRLYGGNPIFTSPGGAGGYCSLGYAVSFTLNGVAKRGILTAGHCPDTMYVDFGDHSVTLSGPVINKPHRDAPPDGADGISDKYDYQIWDTTGLTVDNTIAYEDRNGIPEFPAAGTFRMTSIMTFLNQKAGMIVCKSGDATGITCGEIVNGNATRDGVAGWIRVSNTQQADISEGGDSGGPWFLYPGTSSTITGVGIHTAGSGTGSTSTAVYMPIDYIDDHIGSVNTIKQ
ncbi:MAG TPA: S1 family peptidase [Thermoanaerobaculia bacterium]|nr:S1 family peptidase [Thermoanaerobaculia bacterium]